MFNITTLLISAGLIVIGLFLARKYYKGLVTPPPPSSAASKKDAMKSLMDSKTSTGQSAITGDSHRISSGKKGMFEK